jgi:hypothetical protein
VTSMDIAEALKERGYEIDRHRLHLREPIKRLGDFTVPLRCIAKSRLILQVKVVAEGEVIVGHLTPNRKLSWRSKSTGAREEAAE